MISEQNYHRILLQKRDEAPSYPEIIAISGEDFRVSYSQDDSGLGHFELIDGAGTTIFPCYYEASNLEKVIEADLLNIIANRYFESFAEMDERRAALYLQIRMGDARDNYESWSRRDRAGLIEDRVKVGATPEQIDEILGKPAGYTASLEDFSSDPRVSELVSYHAAIGAASMLKGTTDD